MTYLGDKQLILAYTTSNYHDNRFV